MPTFSGVDLREDAKFYCPTSSGRPQIAHGAIVLSGNAALRTNLQAGRKAQPFTISYSEIGMPIHSWKRRMKRLDEPKASPNGDRILDQATVGIVGWGQRARVAQQFAHMGVGGYVLVDPDHIEHQHQPHLIGRTLKDVAAKARKGRNIRTPDPGLAAKRARYGNPKIVARDAVDDLKRCDIASSLALSIHSGSATSRRFARRYPHSYRHRHGRA